MKKKLLAAAVVLTAVLMLGGCEGLSAKNAKGPETEESCLYITKDGNLLPDSHSCGCFADLRAH